MEQRIWRLFSSPSASLFSVAIMLQLFMYLSSAVQKENTAESFVLELLRWLFHTGI